MCSLHEGDGTNGPNLPPSVDVGVLPFVPRLDVSPRLLYVFVQNIFEVIYQLFYPPFFFYNMCYVP